MTKAKTASPEFHLHCEIVKWLAVALPHGAVVHHSPNSVDMKGATMARQIAKAKKLGMRPGWPDIEIIWRGAFFALEVKAGRNSQSAAQRETERAIQDAGGDYAVVRSLGDAHRALRSWGVPLRVLEVPTP